MQQDLWKYFGILLIAGLLGFSIGFPLLLMLITAVGIIVWQLNRINMLQQWLDKPKANPIPGMGGLFYKLHKKLVQRNNKYNKRKRQLSSLLAQFRKAVGALPDAIILIDKQGKIEWANQNAGDLLGIRWPDDGGVRFTDLIRFSEVERLLSDHCEVDTGIEINSMSNSKNQTINLKCVPYSDTTRMLIARDVSRLIKVNQMHSDFVANVSHELKTPLTVLKGYVEILQNASNLPEQFAKPLEQMNWQAVRMQFIVSDLLYLAKLEDTENKTPHQWVGVTHLINAVIEAVQPLIEEKRHKLELDIDYSLKIKGAETELHSAFSNLITNAINYTPSQGLIRINWKSTDSGAIFAVNDNGLGIAPQHLSRLTQRFYRVDSDRSREGGGTGLGLAIVKHVLQRHNSELEIDSTVGVGSTFKCVFPLSQVSDDNNSQVSYSI